MNPWKEIVATAHDLLNHSDQIITPAKPVALVIRIATLLQELGFARDRARTLQSDLTLANHQLERQAKLIANLQPKSEPPSETPPPRTNEQFNEAIIKESKRRARVRRKKRRDS